MTSPPFGCNSAFSNRAGTSRSARLGAKSGGALNAFVMARVKSAAELLPTLETAFKEGGVHLVVVPIDYSENKRVLVDELRAKLRPAQEAAE